MAEIKYVQMPIGLKYYEGTPHSDYYSIDYDFTKKCYFTYVLATNSELNDIKKNQWLVLGVYKDGKWNVDGDEYGNYHYHEIFPLFKSLYVNIHYNNYDSIISTSPISTIAIDMLKENFICSEYKYNTDNTLINCILVDESSNSYKRFYNPYLTTGALNTFSMYNPTLYQYITNNGEWDNSSSSGFSFWSSTLFGLNSNLFPVMQLSVPIITESGMLSITFDFYRSAPGYLVYEAYLSTLESGNFTDAKNAVYYAINNHSIDPPDPPSPEQPSDPFGDGGTSETGGGGGSFDFESADIPESPLPTLNATATGFTRVFNPSLTQLNALASYLWTTDSFWETVFNHTKQLLENPMQYMIALNMLPVAVPQGSSQSVKFLWIDTGVSMPPVTNQFVDVDCGTYTFNPIYGSALDYSPYTEIELFLPFIGLVQLDTDEVMGKTIQVKYRVDVFTGICVASILVNGSVLYQHQGTCAISIPFSGADFTRYVSAVTTIAKAGISVASASPNAISGSDTTSSNYNNHVYPVTIANAVTNSVAAVVGSKPTIEHTGSFGAVSGYLGTRYCWVNIKAPRMANPDKYGAYNGYPTMVTMNLSECSGFTKVQSIYLNGFGQATADELSELDELLKSGVYLQKGKVKLSIHSREIPLIGY